jgi:Zn-dependent alcohol dehydrogenase
VHTEDGLDVGQMAFLGVLAEKAVVLADACVKVPDETSMRAASLLSCGFTTGAGASIHAARTAMGDSVVVIGVGGVGTAALQGALVAGAGEIIAIDIHDHKLETARQFGATQTINAREHPAWDETVRELTEGRGADKAILCVDQCTGEQIAQTVKAVRKGGVAVLVGNSGGLTEIPVAPWFALSMSHKSIVGTIYGGTNPKLDQLHYLDLYRAGRLKLDEMITNVYPLEDVNRAFEDLTSGKNIRGVIEF